MKVSYYKKFMHQLVELPQKIQRSTLDAIEQFQKDRFLNSLNYEKLNCKDKQLRSIRATGSYRIILHESTENQIYHILWVDNHNEAYRWAENKQFEWNQLTQSYQIFDYQVETIVETIKVEKSSVFMSKFSDEDLLKIGVPKRILEDIKRIDNLDALDRLSTFLPEDVFEHIFYLFEGIDIREIILDVEEGLAAENAAEESANNRRSFLQISDEALRKHLEGDFALWKVFLHPTQRKFVERNYKGPTKITGGAGTGKTVVALHRIKWLLERINSEKIRPIFFTTYTKSLVQHLEANLKTLEVNNWQVLVQNLDKFVVEHLKELNLLKSPYKITDYQTKADELKPWYEVVERNFQPFSAAFLRNEYRDVILYHNIKEVKQYLRITRAGRPERLGRKQRQEIWTLFQEYETLKKQLNLYESWELYNLLFEYYQDNNDKPFEHLICDEVQDFSNVELRLMRSLVAEKNNDLFLVGDPYQSIYDRRINFSKAGINIRGKRSRKLKVNYRTTEEIKRRSIGVIKGEKFEQFEADEIDNLEGYVSLIRGTQPTYQVFENEATEAQYILEILEKHTADNSQQYIALENICIAARTNAGVSRLKKILYGKYDYNSLSNNTAIGNKNGLRLSTFHNLKGMEFKVVILTDLSEDTFPFIPNDLKNEDEYEMAKRIKSEKALLYVAMSRAVHFLYLTGKGQQSKLL
jgi:superfamily I DNA/RNA helicase/mRNA-degrading endonuclease RelE of RelBE toxin-antitoxin system